MESKNKCVIAIEEAINKALEVAFEEIQKSICTKEDFEKALSTVLSDFLGVDISVNPECEEILKKGFTEKVCKDFYEQRRWVMCCAHSKLKKWLEEGKIADFRKAIRECWKELKEGCEKAGYPI